MKTSIEDKRYNARLNYYENKKGLPHDEAVRMAKGDEKTPSSNGDGQPSKWAQRQAEKKAKEEASKAHPLGLPQCPFCKAEFFRKVDGQYEPILMDNCAPCAKRFYFFNGVKA